jgi:hypothetical protein
MKLIALLLVSICLAFTLPTSRGASATPVIADWSQPFVGAWTWSPAKQHASNLVEAGFNDWRLPKRTELVSAIQSAMLPPLTTGTHYYWTSEKQGNRAWAVLIVADANGDPIVAQSGSATLLTQSSFVLALATRP